MITAQHCIIDVINSKSLYFGVYMFLVLTIRYFTFLQLGVVLCNLVWKSTILIEFITLLVAHRFKTLCSPAQVRWKKRSIWSDVTCHMDFIAGCRAIDSHLKPELLIYLCFKPHVSSQAQGGDGNFDMTDAKGKKNMFSLQDGEPLWARCGGDRKFWRSSLLDALFGRLQLKRLESFLSTETDAGRQGERRLDFNFLTLTGRWINDINGIHKLSE